MPNETIDKKAKTNKKKFCTALTNLTFEFEKSPNNKTSIYDDKKELIEGCVNGYNKSCGNLKKAIEEYINAENKNESIKSKIGEKLHLGLKLDLEKMKTLKEKLDVEIKQPKYKSPAGMKAETGMIKSQLEDISSAMDDLRESITSSSDTNRKIREKLATFKKQIDANQDMVNYSNESNAKNNEIEEKTKAYKKEFLESINKLRFSFEPVIDTTRGGETIADENSNSTTAYKESCEKLKEAVNKYITAKTNSNKSKLKSALSLKLNSECMKELSALLNTNNFKSKNITTVVKSCDELSEKMEELRKSIKPTSPTNIKIRSKLSSFKDQLDKNLDIWNNDPRNEKSIKKK